MSENSMRENRETPLVSGSRPPDRLVKAMSYTASTHASGESDELVVPAKRPNQEEPSSAEGVEGSGSTKGNTEEAHTHANFRNFVLELHPEKTRLIELGRFAEEHRKRRGEGTPETFDFLGFTHLCGTTRKGNWFTTRRQTIKKRLRSKLQAVRQELRKRWHERIADTGDWLRSVVQGSFNYHAVPGNFVALQTFRREVARAWLEALRRRSQRHRLPWERFRSILDRYLPLPRILHPEPGVRFDAMHPR